jgi:hypothetical protein
MRDCTVLSFLGIMLFLLAAVDASCLLLGWPLTDYSWSPLIFATVGFLLVTLEALERDSSPSGRSGAPRQAWTEERAPLAQTRSAARRPTESAPQASASRT